MASLNNLPPFPNNVPTVELPIINLHLIKAHDANESRRMLEACQGLGFFWLESHLINPVPLFDMADATFDLPMQEKMKYAMAPGKYLGYKPAGLHIVDDKGTPDVFETYHISRDDIVQVPTIIKPQEQPQTIREREPELRRFMTFSHVATDAICRVLSVELGLDPEALPSRHSLDMPSGSHARITRAPPVSADTICLGEHSDFGSITLLFNALGGLQVLLPGTREWKYIRPKRQMVCVNLGDAMVKFTGGRLVSGVHRVVGPPGEQARCTRHSVAYFSRPNGELKLGNLFVDQSLWKNELTADQWIERRVRGLASETFRSAEQWHEQRGTEHHKEMGLEVRIKREKSDVEMTM